MEKKTRLPDFLVLGAAKSGTTTLYQYLSGVPSIYMPRRKEPCFFDADVGWNKGLEWYVSLFADARCEQICGEASTNYSRWPQVADVPRRIADIIPDVNFIYLMRHPIECAYSHYIHRYTKELYPGKPFAMTFEDFVVEEPMCLDSSDYAMQLDQYLAFFPESRFLLLLFEELVEDPTHVVLKTLRFLGASEQHDWSVDTPLAANRSADFAGHSVRATITAPFRRNQLIRFVANRVPKSWRENSIAMLTKSVYGRRVQRSFVAPPMKKETRKELIERFRPSNERISRMLGKDLSHWNH